MLLLIANKTLCYCAPFLTVKLIQQIAANVNFKETTFLYTLFTVKPDVLFPEYCNIAINLAMFRDNLQIPVGNWSEQSAGEYRKID